MAYIVTRPLGSSLGDYLSQSRADGGFGLGTAGTSAIFLVTILTLVIYLTKSEIDETPAAKSAKKQRSKRRFRSAAGIIRAACAFTLILYFHIYSKNIEMKRQITYHYNKSFYHAFYHSQGPANFSSGFPFFYTAKLSLLFYDQGSGCNYD
jgi:multisubunit Na+/H+ antiporter MnhB subunit